MHIYAALEWSSSVNLFHTIGAPVGSIELGKELGQLVEALRLGGRPRTTSEGISPGGMGTVEGLIRCERTFHLPYASLSRRQPSDF